jgi:hypothetical protein
MWGHHPAFGAPFLSATCRIDTNAKTLIADRTSDAPGNPLDPGRSYEWPWGGRGDGRVDLSAVPGPGVGQSMLGYFSNYQGEHGWYGITNTELGFGVGLVWPIAAFPHAWFWQELNASSGYPWYRGVYTMAIEPGTSYPGQGLVSVIEQTGLHRTLQPGESAEAALRAVFYESNLGVAAIDGEGRVTTVP